MDVLKLRITGRWAQFRKPETNNNPLTHDFITKSALIGLMGAVLGKERKTQMSALFPQLSEDLRYGVAVNGVVKKESWGFTLRSANSYFSIFERRNLKDLLESRAPKQMEFLRDPDFTVVIALYNERSREIFDDFCAAIRNDEACYTPILGLHNCPAELKWNDLFNGNAAGGDFVTQGFVPRDYKLGWDPSNLSMRVGYEKIPTYQNNDWWNLPDRYVAVAYPSNGTTLNANGDHFKLNNGETWCLI